MARERGAHAGGSSSHWTRRRLMASALPIALFAAACGGDSSGEGSREVASGGQPASGTAAAARQPKGELRVGVSRVSFPPTLDPIKSFGSSYALRFGVGETLTRLTPDLALEPWLAQSVTALDPTTWRVTIRPNVWFHDGSPVMAQDVAASLRQVVEALPAAAAFLPMETQIKAVDPATLTFTTPTPVGAFPNNLASFYFTIFKQVGETAHYTGPYKLSRLETDVRMTLQAYPEHWAGPPPLATIQARLVADSQAEMLALQAGDLDLGTTLSPEQVKGLPSGVEAKVTPGLRIHYVRLNVGRPLFAERAVREAFALGIDRDAINTAVFDGQGEPATGLFPKGVATFDVLPIQATDVGRAQGALEAAGWSPGAGGVRSKDGRRLAFTLYSSGGTAPTAQAQVIQAQLRPLGFDIQVQDRQDFQNLLATGDYDAVMTSIGTLPTGEPGYLYNVALAKDGSFSGGYSHSQLDALVAQLRVETDPAKRNALSRQVQEIVRADVPYALLAFGPQIAGIRAGKVKNYAPHPNDLYLIDDKVAVE